MKEAEYYHPLSDGRMACDLCPHHCTIAEGHAGICRSRINHDGKLWATSYGRPCALAIDPIEKKPIARWHSGTECLSIACTGCNFRCLNCQNHTLSQVGHAALRRAWRCAIDSIRSPIPIQSPSPGLNTSATRPAWPMRQASATFSYRPDI